MCYIYPMDVLIGTKNKYKATEMVSLLGKVTNLKIHFLDELNLNIKIEEDQKTLRKNAEKKATGISKLTDYYVITSDGGVDIPGLGGKWMSHLWYYPQYKKVFNRLTEKEKGEVRKQGLGIKTSLRRKIGQIMENNLESILQKKGGNKDVPVVFIFKNDKLLIGLRNYTPDKWKNISVWTAPGGRCDNGETFETTLRREVSEEVGINDLKITEYLGNVPGAKEGDIVFVFKAETTQEPKLMETEKFSEWKWCLLSEIPSNFINPESLKLI